MIRSILVVCVGNICRSPVGEALLRSALPNVQVASAGLGAMTGQGADPTMAEVAADAGIDLAGHVARQFSSQDAARHDLILVMEASQRDHIAAQWPHLRGRTFRFDRDADVPDPYRRPRAAHAAVVAQLQAAVPTWVRLAGTETPR